MLGKDPATLTKGERAIAKMINFGIIYGISAFGLSENLEIPREQAQAYIDAYLARFPHVQDFIERTIEQAERDGYATSLLGRRRPVPEIRASNRADALARRAARRQLRHAGLERGHHQGGDGRGSTERLRDEGRGARLVLQVHDELLLEVPEVEVERRHASSCAQRDVRRVSARPAARRRRRRRRRLERGEGLSSESLLVLGEREVRELLDMESCVEAVAMVLAALARGEVFQPLRAILGPPDASGLIGVMPVHRAGASPAYGLKEIVVTPDNPTRGLDAHQGSVLLHDGEMGGSSPS